MADSETAASPTPLLVDLSGRTVVIFGAGRIALRKARFFAGGAQVRVVADAFHRGFEDLPVERVRAWVDDPEPFLEEAFLVVPATDDDELNHRIVAAARARGCLVNAAAGEGDVAVPALVRRGDLLVAISTSGQAPALARHLRRRLEAFVGPEWAALVELQDRLRRRLRSRVPSQRMRAEILRRCVEDADVWDALAAGDRDAAWVRCLALAGEEADPGALEP